MFTIEKHKVKGDAFKFAKEMVKAQGKRVKSIGSGSYGEVFAAKGSDVVYKIGDMSDNDGYLAYINALAKQKTANPFFPKIYGVRIIEGKDSDDYWDDEPEAVFVVAMERLAPLKGEQRKAADWFHEELDGYSNDVSDGEVLLGIKRDMPKMLTEALKVLRETHGKCRNADWDLHSGNFMMRGKQVVVTDPLA